MPTPGKLQHINFNILLTMIMMPTPGGGGGGSTTALPGLCPGELKIKMSSAAIFVWSFMRQHW